MVRSSWSEYLGKPWRDQNICSGKDIILNQFESVGDYRKFANGSILEIIDRGRKEDEIKELILEWI